MRIATASVDLRTGDVPGNLAAAIRAVDRCATLRADLAVLPEMWPTSFVASAGTPEFDAGDAAVRAVCDRAASYGLTVCGSAFGRPSSRAAGALPTNRAHVLHEGSVAAVFDKVHLFSPTAEHLAFSAGEEPPPVVAIGSEAARLSPLVCYDLRFPGVARAAFRSGAEVLAVSAQWPDARSAHWSALVRGRAAELVGFVVACNRTGEDEIGRRRMRLAFDGDISGVFGPSGAEIEPETVEWLDEPSRAPTRLALTTIDLDEARQLRRALPVAKDERTNLMRDWTA